MNRSDNSLTTSLKVVSSAEFLKEYEDNELSSPENFLESPNGLERESSRRLNTQSRQSIGSDGQ